MSCHSHNIEKCQQGISICLASIYWNFFRILVHVPADKAEIGTEYNSLRTHGTKQHHDLGWQTNFVNSVCNSGKLYKELLNIHIHHWGFYSLYSAQPMMCAVSRIHNVLKAVFRCMHALSPITILTCIEHIGWNILEACVNACWIYSVESVLVLSATLLFYSQHDGYMCWTGPF